MNWDRAAGSPILASPQGGVAASPKKLRVATETDAAGVVYLWFHRKTTPASQSADASQYFLIAQPPLIVFKMKGYFILMDRRRACGKCGKAERFVEAFPSSCGNPHQEEAAEGHRLFCGFP